MPSYVFENIFPYPLTFQISIEYNRGRSVKISGTIYFYATAHDTPGCVLRQYIWREPHAKSNYQNKSQRL